MKQNRLTAEVKTFIVQALARYLGPTQVRDEVKTEFDIECSIQQVQFYDPTKGGPTKKLDKHLRALFAETREAFRKTTAEHAIADIGYRVGRLQRMSERAERMKNFPLAAALLEQAAKDVGGSFTNRREVAVTDERDLAHSTAEQAITGLLRRCKVPETDWNTPETREFAIKELLSNPEALQPEQAEYLRGLGVQESQTVS